MIYRRALSVVLTLLLTAVAARAESVLQAIPTDALGFAVAKNAADLDAKIQKLGARLQVPMPGPLATMKMLGGIQQGLDDQGSLAVAVMPAEEVEGDPVVALLLPASDYQKLIAQLQPADASARVTPVVLMGEDYLVGHKDGYALFVDPEHSQTLTAILDAKPRIDREIKPLVAWLHEADAAMVVKSAGITLICAKIQAGLEEAKAGLAELGEQMQPAIGMFDMYSRLLQAIEQGVDTYAARVRVDDQENLFLQDITRLSPGSALAEMFADIKPLKDDPANGLPAVPYVFAGGGVLPERLATGLIEFSARMTAIVPKIYGIPAEKSGQLADIYRQTLTGLRGMSMTLGVPKPGQGMYGNTAALLQVDDAADYLKRYAKSLKDLKELTADQEEPSLFGGFQFQQTKIDGAAALKGSMDITQLPGMPDVPQMRSLMEAMYGPGGKVTFYLIVADNDTIVAAYSEEIARETLKLVRQGKPGLVASISETKTAKLLPGGQWAAYWSLPGTSEFFKTVFRSLTQVGLPMGPIADKWPEFPESPPVGLSAKAEAGQITGTMVVPAETITATGVYIQRWTQAVQAMIEQQQIAPEVP